jgi:putative sterol carrier protein
LAVKFLSEEWAQAITDALNSSDDFRRAAANQQARLQQVVTDTPDGGDAKYYIKLEGGTVEVAIGELRDAEVTISQNYETAAAISRLELNAQNAFMTGKLKIQGNMMKLLQLQGVVGALPKAISTVPVEY